MTVCTVRDRLIAILAGRESAAGIAPAEWSRLVATARAANLLGSLAERVQRDGVEVACGAMRHLEGARQLSERQRRSVRWEVQCLNDALLALDLPIVLLKGAAYVLGEHRNARGRLFGDIDILVPAQSIGDVEIQLMINGWTSGKLDAYDQRYYRQWMHEIPPLVHMRRGTVLDVHHTILPPTAGHATQAARIIERARTVEGLPALRVPCAEDLVIHSLTHLMHEGELHNGLRDLHDIHVLLSEHASGEGFWERLAGYAREQDLAVPVAQGLGLARRFFGTGVPEGFIEALAPGRRDGRLALLYDLAMRPGKAPTAADGAAAFILYLRSHWLRMPTGQLLVHLTRKAWMRLARDGAPPQAE